MWVALTLADVLRSVTDAERNAMRTAAVGAQSDPVSAVIADVVKEVRGYVAANTSNDLSADTAMIPDELRNAALARVRFEAFTRLPIGRSLLTEDRVAANSAATRLLQEVAAGRFVIEAPAVPSTQVIPQGSGAQLLKPLSTTIKPYGRFGTT